MSTGKASAAVQKSIAAVVLQLFGRDDLYVSQPPAGLGLSDLHLDLLQQLQEDRLDDVGSVARLLEISRIVDCIQVHPEIATTPAQEPNYLSDVFPRVVGNVQFTAPPLTDSQRLEYDTALTRLYIERPFSKTPLYHEFCVLRSDVEKLDVVRTAMQQKLRDLEGAEKQALELDIRAYEELLTQKREQLEAMDREGEFSRAEAIVEAAERQNNAVPASIRSALDMMELFQITDPLTGQTHVGCSFFPSSLTEENWVPVRLTQTQIANMPGGGGSATDDANAIADEDIESIEFEMQTLTCQREWLWSNLFDNHNWKWQSPWPPVSTGFREGTERALIPAYIYAFVFIRNLRVNLQDSASVQANLLSMVKRLSPVGPLLRTVGQANMDPEPGTAAVPVRQPRRTNLALHRRNQLARRSQLRGHVDPGLGDDLNGLGLTGRVVDTEGHGIWPASVTLEPPGPVHVPDPTDSTMAADPLGPQTHIRRDDSTLRRQPTKRETRTGRDGYFRFPDVIGHGEYYLTVQASGFEQVQEYIPFIFGDLVISMQPAASARIQVRLQWEDGTPFTGTATVLISTPSSRRQESMDGRSEAVFPVLPGEYSIAVSSPDAHTIVPGTLSVVARDFGREECTFTLSPKAVVVAPQVQVHGFICRRVPPCPSQAA